MEISDQKAHEIVLHESPDEVKRLLQKGYDVNKVYECNILLNTAIKSATLGARMVTYPLDALEKVKILVEAGADVNLVPCPQKSMSPLGWAVSLPASLAVTERKVNEGIDWKIKNKIGQCDVPTVVSKPCKDITSEEREKIRETFHSTYVALGEYYVPYFMEIIKYLVNHGANVNGNENENAAPIHLAVMNPIITTQEPLKFLIQKGANVNAQDNFGNTPLFWAWNTNKDAADILIKAGANINIRNKDGFLFNEVTTKNMHSIINNTGKLINKEI